MIGESPRMTGKTVKDEKIDWQPLSTRGVHPRLPPPRYSLPQSKVKEIAESNKVDEDRFV